MQGILCRFGMAGIIAESHYDAGRNFIAMINGTKRYILSPPSECDRLFLLKEGPSARHSSVDWSDPAVIPSLAPARAVEVVIRTGDVLYVPAMWFHYIISLDTNIQVCVITYLPAVHDWLENIFSMHLFLVHGFDSPFIDDMIIVCSAMHGLAPPMSMWV